jgi:hypothetical protein
LQLVCVPSEVKFARHHSKTTVMLRALAAAEHFSGSPYIFFSI